MMSQQEAENFVKGLFTEVWCDRNKDAVKKYYHEDFKGVLNGEEEFVFADVLKRVDYSKARYQDNQVTGFHDIFPAQENRIVARVSMQGFDTQTEKVVPWHFLFIVELKDGKMHRQWASSGQAYRYKDWR